MYLPVTYMKE